MQLELLNEQGQATSKVDAPDTVFARDYNEALVHQIVVAFQANARQGTRAQKDRETVKHSTKKPWRQKGTGRARAGMTSSPLWRGGGRIFPNSPDENFTQKVNKKMYRAGMAAILSQLAREGRLAVVDSITVDSPKTKLLAAEVQGHGPGLGAGHRRRMSTTTCSSPRATCQRARHRAALRRSAVAGALQEGAGDQGRDRASSRRCSHEHRTQKVRRRPPGAVLVAPIISEKATIVAEKHNQVLFKVLRDATKPEIKAAVELMFKVEVEVACQTVLSTRARASASASRSAAATTSRRPMCRCRQARS